MNSKNKGNRFERKIGSWFTSWSGYRFERNRAGSGSWWSNKDSSSDITCTDDKHAHRCKLSIECKNYKDIKFEHVLLGNKNCDILKFWEQVSNDAKRTSKYPILCMRYNSMPSEEFFFVIQYDGIGESIHECLEKNSMILVTNEVKLLVCMATDIKDNIDYKQFHKSLKEYLKS